MLYPGIATTIYSIRINLNRPDFLKLLSVKHPSLCKQEDFCGILASLYLEETPTSKKKKITNFCSYISGREKTILLIHWKQILETASDQYVRGQK